MSTPTTLRTILAAALLTLAACSGNTDDLRPKGPGDCPFGFKACGYKCVSVLDAGTGCGSASCDACPGAFAFCEPSGSSYVCGGVGGGCVPLAGQADCDGVGACEDLTTDELNCGACGRACDFDSSSHTTRYACTAGFCDLGGIPAGDSARGIAWSERDQALYWTDTSVATGGRLVRWSPTLGDFSWTSSAWTVLAEGATGPDARGVLGSPALTRIASNPLRPELYLTGWLAGSGTDFAIYRWDPTATTPALVPVRADVFVNGYDSITGLAALGSWVMLDRSDVAQPEITDGTTIWYASTTATTPLHGLAAYDLSAYAVYWGSGGGTLSIIDQFGNDATIRDALAGVPNSYMRVAVYMGGSFPEFAWASESDGSVWRWVNDGVSAPEQIHVGAGSYTAMEIALDGLGVYWMDRRAGKIHEWRRDGTELELARGVTPNGIAIDAGFVYFTDDAGYVRRAPK